MVSLNTIQRILSIWLQHLTKITPLNQTHYSIRSDQLNRVSLIIFYPLQQLLQQAMLLNMVSPSLLMCLTHSIKDLLLNQFGTFTAINKLEVGDGYAAVPYSNVTNLLIGVYKLPELTLSESADNTAKVLTMTGGELVSYWNAPTTFAMVLQKDPVYGEVNHYFKI